MHITVKVVAIDSAVAALSVAITITLMCISLSQHCHYHCYHSAVLVFAVTALCTSVSDRRSLELFSKTSENWKSTSKDPGTSIARMNIQYPITYVRYYIHLIPKAWSEHGVEALWTGQKNIGIRCKLHSRTRPFCFLSLGIFCFFLVIAFPTPREIYIDSKCSLHKIMQNLIKHKDIFKYQTMGIEFLVIRLALYSPYKSKYGN